MSEPSTGVLLDTCAIIWLMNGSLKPNVVAQIVAAGIGGGIYVSPISAWEVGMLARPKPGRASGPQFLPDAKTWFSNLMTAPGIRPAPFTHALAIDASFLPGDLHADPADRLIIATSRALHMPIVTSDERIIAYARAGHAEVIAC